MFKFNDWDSISFVEIPDYLETEDSKCLTKEKPQIDISKQFKKTLQENKKLKAILRQTKKIQKQNEDIKNKLNELLDSCEMKSKSNHCPPSEYVHIVSSLKKDDYDKLPFHSITRERFCDTINHASACLLTLYWYLHENTTLNKRHFLIQDFSIPQKSESGSVLNPTNFTQPYK